MRILVTNDDGIHAEGLAVLEEIAQSLSNDIGVVAPAVERSGASHSISITTSLRIDVLGPKRLSVHGNPADCVLVGVETLWDDGKMPDLVLSGVNRGGNLGGDVQVSGTIGAAEQAVQMGLQGIALSQVYSWGAEINWLPARRSGAAAIRALLEEDLQEGEFFSLNFPSELATNAEMMITQSATSMTEIRSGHMTSSPFGRNLTWLHPKASVEVGLQGKYADEALVTDVKTVALGCIAATPLQISRDSHQYLLKQQGKRFRLHEGSPTLAQEIQN